MCSSLELARLIEKDLAHWYVCNKYQCAECAFINKILALAGNMIFSEQTWDVKSFWVLKEEHGGAGKAG